MIFSVETQNPRSRVVAKDHLHVATGLVGLSGSSAEITGQGSSNSDDKYGSTRQRKAMNDVLDLHLNVQNVLVNGTVRR